jgi:hypothetical protein
MRGREHNPMGNPKYDREKDQERRAQAQARKPLIAKWDTNIPAGYIHVDDAIEYMRRRWGKMMRAEMLENFSRDDTGPRYTMFGDWPDKSRGERHYAFDDIDMWVYRTMTGVPAGWRDIRKLPKGQQSTMPVTMVENLYGGLRRPVLDGMKVSNGEEPSDGRTGIEEDGRRRN